MNFFPIQPSRNPARHYLCCGKNCSAFCEVKRLLFKSKTKSSLVKQKPLPPLSFCLLMDLLGYATFAVPFFGEFFDLVWAPISALIYWRTFGGFKGFFGGGFNFLEELLPGTDIIPTFTITWFLQYMKRRKDDTYAVRPL
jgi:hypothetical protein